MKIIGAIAVIGSCFGIGMTRIRCIRLEMLALESLAGGIRAIRAELSSRLCPMSELLARAEERAGSDAGGFFRVCAGKMADLNEKSFAELWKDAVLTTLPVLSEGNRAQLEALGASLGRYDMDEQLAACDRYLRSSEEAASSLRSKLPELRRLTLAISAAAGIFLCLLIL